MSASGVSQFSVTIAKKLKRGEAKRTFTEVLEDAKSPPFQSELSPPKVPASVKLH